MSGDRASEIACQQDSAENRGARNQIQNSAGEQNEPEWNKDALRISELNGRLYDKFRLNQFHHAIEEKK